MPTKKKASDGGFNLTTALLLLVMLLVVVVSLMANMLFETERKLEQLQSDAGMIQCIPITNAPSPTAGTNDFSDYFPQ